MVSGNWYFTYVLSRMFNSFDLLANILFHFFGLFNVYVDCPFSIFNIILDVAEWISVLDKIYDLQVSDQTSDNERYVSIEDLVYNSHV